MTVKQLRVLAFRLMVLRKISDSPSFEYKKKKEENGGNGKSIKQRCK